MPAARETRPQDPPVLSATQARGGLRGVHLIWVLVISLGLIVVIYAVMVGSLWGGRLSQPGGQTRAEDAAARSFNAPPPQPRQSENTPAPATGRGQGQ